MLVLLFVLALENSAYLAVRVMEENSCQRIGLSFSAPKSHRSSMSTTTRTSTIPGGDRSRRLSVLRVPARAVTQFKGSVLAIFQFRLRARHLIATCVACFMRTCKVLIFFNLVFIPVLVFSFCGPAYIVRSFIRCPKQNSPEVLKLFPRDSFVISTTRKYDGKSTIRIRAKFRSCRIF